MMRLPDSEKVENAGKKGRGYTLFTGLGAYFDLYSYHKNSTEIFAKDAAQDALTLAGMLERRLKRPIKGMRILEIGCGQRFPVTLALHSLGAEVVGIDLEPVGPGLRKYGRILAMGSPARLLKTAAREMLFDGVFYRAFERRLGVALRFDGLRILQASVTALPFDDGAFDAIVSGAVFEHLPDLPSAIDEVRRVMAPQGVARILIHLFASLSGGHHLEWQSDKTAGQRTVPAWDHILENRHPAHVYLNRLRKADYLRVFGSKMRLIKTWTKTEGLEFLTPSILKAAKSRGFLRRELLERELIVLVSPKKRRS
jgi:SAM-dependent methyltransferase